MATDRRSVHRRAVAVVTLLLATLAGLGWRAWQITVVEHERWAALGHRQQIRSYRVPAARGDVVDRTHVALAVNDRVHQVVVNPRAIVAEHRREAVIAGLSQLVPTITREELEAAIPPSAVDPQTGAPLRLRAYARLRAKLSEAEAAAVRAAKLPGVRLEPVPDRVYPRGLLAAHVLGRVDDAGGGNLGIEYGMDEWLRGRDALSPATAARGKQLLVDGAPDARASDGHTVVTTIDAAIQAMAEEEIDALVGEWHPVGASIVVLAPSSGEVLAIANRPTFDPNHGVNELRQTTNLAVQAAYEPGSTMKAITVAAALEQGVLRRDETFFCENGKWQYTPEHAISDTKRIEWASVTEILAASSNIGTTKIYEQLGKESLHRWVQRFHFGERPPIELPGATAGLLADWTKWSDIQAANVSFGQGMSASPLQVAAAFATLANDGVYRPPHLVRHVLADDGSVVWEPDVSPDPVVRPSTARTVLEMLESVVHSPKGTGKDAAIPGYRVAGKTSTAQKANRSGRGYEDGKYYASFVGAVPARAPAVVILVSVDEPEGGHYGNDVAAPAFARLGARVLQHLAIPRDDAGAAGIAPETIALAATDARLVEGFADHVDVEPALPGQRRRVQRTGMPDFTGLGLAAALDAASRAEVELRAVGSGVAVMQDVPAGESRAGTVVTVVFEPPT
jgi:cell division protein FtsI (penicillin-binding protein 3)